MPERISADPDTGKATVKRTAFDLDTDQTLSLVSCDVIRTNDQDTSGQANPDWFADLGLADAGNADRLESEHTAEFHTADAAAAGVSYFEYRIVVTDGTFEAGLTVPVVLAGKGRAGAAALLWVSGSKVFRLALPYAGVEPTLLHEGNPFNGSYNDEPDEQSPGVVVEHQSALYLNDGNFSRQATAIYVNSGNTFGFFGDRSFDGSSYDSARDSVLCSSGRDIRLQTHEVLWSKESGDSFGDIAVDNANQEIYTIEGADVNRRNLSSGALIETLPEPPRGDIDRAYLRYDEVAEKLFAVVSSGWLDVIAVYDGASGAWSEVFHGGDYGLSEGIETNFDLDEVNQRVYFGTGLDGFFSVPYGGGQPTQIVPPSESWFGGQVYALSVFVNPSQS